MAARDPEVRRISARIGATGKHHPGADTTDLQRELKEAKADEYIRDLVAAWPPLTDDQRDRLAALLRPARAEAQTP